MHLRFSLVSLILFSAAAVALAQAPQVAPFTCSDLKLVPAPRECSAVEVVQLGIAGPNVFTIQFPSQAKSGLDFIDPDLLPAGKAEGLPLVLALHFDQVRSGENPQPTIRVVPTNSHQAKALLARQHLQLDPPMHDEGYVIVPDGPQQLAIIAETSAGLFYGLQTVKQLIRGSGKDAVLLVPTIRDWPAMPHRGLSDDWSRGPLPTMDFLKREIRTLAAYKINIFSPYFEHTFAYASSPVAAFPGGAMTPAEARELVAYAARYHITVVPEQEAFGHLHNLLKFEQFSALGESAHGAVLAPGDAATLPLIAGWFSELAQVFPGPYAHIGADETFELGLGRTREAVQQQGLGAVYLDYLKKIHSTLEPNHKRLLFWGDVAVNSPELVGTLPKDMIAVPWEYDAKPDFTPLILPFTNAGLETWVAPGVNNWNRIYPNNNEALGNIRAFVRDGQKLGSTGELNTVWNDDGEGIFDENWFGVLFGAAAGWQAGESSEEAFTASFGQAFHGDVTGKVSQAQRELMAAHNLFKQVGLRDAQDATFWIDPFSPDGQSVAGKLRPVLSELRLHAERAITLVAEAKAAAALDHRTLENPEALDALELGARRIDFVGLKFQAADECVSAYSAAQALVADQTRWPEVMHHLRVISSNEGRLEDISNGYLLLGALYRQAWLRDNRPYWLDNIQARYDRAAQLWMARSERWHGVLDQWRTNHTLPPAAESGLPEPAGK
jgi:hypothetical protein